MPANVKERKSKAQQFQYARDNAISALGKIIRYQGTNVDLQSLLGNWLSLLPLKSDLDESKIQNEILASLLLENPTLVFGEQFQRFELVILVLAEILQKKYVEDETGLKLARFLQGVASDSQLGPHFKAIFDNKVTEEAQKRLSQALSYT